MRRLRTHRYPREKVRRLKLPKAQSVSTVLIHSGEPDHAIDASGYFDQIDQWLAG